MDFDAYQEKISTFAKYPDIGNNVVYPALGLCGEAGEVAEKVKKVLRDKGGVFDDETKAAIAKELGDVQWYLARLAAELGFKLSDIAQGNIDKLMSRNARGVLQGSGDNR